MEMELFPQGLDSAHSQSRFLWHIMWLHALSCLVPTQSYIDAPLPPSLWCCVSVPQCSPSHRPRWLTPPLPASWHPGNLIPGANHSDGMAAVHQPYTTTGLQVYRPGIQKSHIVQTWHSNTRTTVNTSQSRKYTTLCKGDGAGYLWFTWLTSQTKF